MFTQLIKESVQSIMDDTKFEPMVGHNRKLVVESVLGNQLEFMQNINESDVPTNQTSGVANFEPVLIKMVRQSMPKLMAFDLMGVQAMSAPTGSIFAMHARYGNQSGPQALFNEANSGFSGAGTQTGDTSGFAADAFGVDNPEFGTSTGTGMAQSVSELLGSTGNTAWPEMGFTVDKTTVEAKSRNLKSQFSRDLQYDMKKVHGLDADTELARILSTEIRAEIDRETLRTVNIAAKLGAQHASVPGLFDLQNDSDGRWLVERIKGLLMQIELEANAIAIATRRGRGNRITCSSNVASAISIAGLLEYNPQLAAALNVDTTSTTYAGTLLNKYQVMIDPYATRDYISLGYVGAHSWDNGIFMCPYLPLEMYRSVGEDNFNPKIGFSTRYGIVANPFEQRQFNGSNVLVDKPGKGLGQGENSYYRKFAVAGIGV